MVQNSTGGPRTELRATQVRQPRPTVKVSWHQWLVLPRLQAKEVPTAIRGVLEHRDPGVPVGLAVLLTQVADRGVGSRAYRHPPIIVLDKVMHFLVKGPARCCGDHPELNLAGRV